MRGKYAVNNKYYIINMLKQMTQEEKNVLKQGDFDEVWFKLWGGNMISNQYKNEESTSREKYNSLVQGILVKDGIYTLRDLIEESDKDKLWTEAEWGFPKGRRNFQETDLNCAIREFEEETGFNRHKLTLIKNVLPFEEIFTGSNYKSYKHKYFLVYMKYDDSLDMDNFEKAEVSKMEWLSFTDCITHIRYYNTEKQILIQKVNECLTQCSIVQ
jgi:8-oxo-dGTP pyrophosphatase MutT (NUDIX family)